MKVYIIGTGMDGEKTLVKEAETAICNCELLVGAERMLRPFENSGKELFYSYNPQDIAEKLNNCGYSTAGVLMSGDTGFFSGARKIIPLIENHDSEIICGISSVAYFCGKIGLSYEKMKFVSLHGRDGNIAVNTKTNRHCFFLLGGKLTVADVCRCLCSYGMSDVRVWAGISLGCSDERILSGKAFEFSDTSADGLAVMITENKNFVKYIPSAISDGLFKREKIPMTKSEVRCVAVSKLNINSDSVVWDVGCGTGSVSVESSFRCTDGKVFSFDVKSGAVNLTLENARKFGCDNITAVLGECPEVLENIPAPDKVFIGGSGGKMSGILGAVYSKNPTADVAVTAVSLETLGEALKCFEHFGKVPEIVQLSVVRTEKAGSHTMLQAQNPVFVITAVNQDGRQGDGQ